MMPNGNLSDRTVDEHGNTRDHAVLCADCLRNVTWNIDAICDPCCNQQEKSTS